MTKNKSRKLKEDKNIKSGFDSDIKGILLITLGILMLMSLFLTDSSGIIGKTIKKMFLALMGIGSYFFPFIIIFVGVTYIITNGKMTFNRRFYGILFFLINSLMFIQMLTLENYYVSNNLIEGIKKIYYQDKITHGGILSYLIDVPIYTLFGNTGAYIIFTAIYVISIILILQITINDFLSLFKSKEDSEIIDKNDLKTSDDRKRNQESFIKNINDKIKVIKFMKSNESNDQLTDDLKKENDIKVFDHQAEHKKMTVANKTNTSQYENKEIAIEDINEELNTRINEEYSKDTFQYIYPPIDLINHNHTASTTKNSKKDLISSASKLEETLNSFGVDAKVIQVTKGPSVTRFELQPSAGVKVSKITHLSDDIALSLAASSIRIEAPIPGKSAVGIEVPNSIVSSVYLREVIESEEFINFNKNIAFAIGKDIGGNCIVADLSKMPHLLIAGATGSGKSVCINTLIVSILYKYSPEDVKLLLVDPKVVELNVYNEIPHLLIPVVTNPKKAAGALNWAVTEMTRRYNLFAENNVRNIEGYNELFNKGKIDSKIPWIVIVIDELADLMMVCPGEVEEYIARLAQMARAAGMHLVIATQRPSVDVITGVIKANIPSRIAFSVSSQIDSRTIIDSAGAEKLLGKGDMLFYPVGESKPIRIQGAFISEEEVEKIVNFIKSQKTEIVYEENILDEINTVLEKKESDSDELLDEAIQIVVESGQASTSLLQRKLRIGYNRAARLIEELEAKGVISGRNGSKPRQVLLENESLSSNN